MISIKTLFSRKYIFHTILLFVILGIFAFSVTCFFVTQNLYRRIFIFPSADEGQYIIEYRNLAKKSKSENIEYFIDELLLGSTIERTKFVFTPGTRVLSCFQRGNILYLNLSSDLLNMGEGVIEIREGVRLLEKNVKNNFSRIEKIELFVNGKIAFEN